MAGPLNIIPPGFLGFLQLKNFGKNPSEVPEVIAPTFDMLSWYMQGEAVPMAGTDATRACTSDLDGFVALTSNTITVPDGEWWFVHNVYLYASLPAATTEFFSGSPCWFNANTFQGEVLCPPGQLIQGVAALTRRYFTAARDFFVPPGSQFGAYVLTCETATSITVGLNGRITRLPI